MKINFGHIDLRSWVEYDGINYFGMYRKIVYDKYGNITEYTEGKTGIILNIKEGT